MKYFIICLVLWLKLLPAFAQDTDSTDAGEDDAEVWVIPPINEQMKLGVKMGAGMFMIGGEEANKPYPLFGLAGGAYFRYRFKTHWSLQLEAMASIRGGRFDNKTDEYGTIRAYFADVPLLLLYGLNEKNTTNVFIGAQYSNMLNAVLFKTNAQVQETQAPALSKHDVMLIAGAQFHTPFVGFQLALKYGLLDANKGVSPNIGPVNQGKNFRHLALECCFLF